jgi:uncharacterized protein (TIGR03435 family)
MHRIRKRIMEYRITTFVIFTAAALMSVAAGAPGDKPQFEVASIKPNTSDSRFVNIPPPIGGRFKATNVTLTMLLGVAYRVRPNQISGGPNWMGSERYDIETRAQGNPTRDEFTAMLQSLLEERFQLVSHKETREQPVYALMIAKNGPKLPPPKETCAAFSPNNPPPPPPPPGQPFRPQTPCGGFLMMPGRMEAGKVGMAQLVNTLSNAVGRPVIDKTGYTELFDVHLEWSPVDGGGRGGPPGGGGPVGEPGQPGPAGGQALPQADISGPTIFTALQDQLGLRLESQKGPVEILVVDRAEKASEN